MTDPRWFEINEDVAAACDHFRRSVALHAAGGFAGDSLESYRARMALMHAMQAAHTSLESALVRTLSLLGEPPPIGADWHADLIRRVARDVGGRPRILPPELASAADETRRFRHIAMKAYGSFDVTRARAALAAAEALAMGLEDAMQSFQSLIDPSDRR